jgi:hypothetical protein
VPRTTLDFDAVRQLSRELAGVEEGTAYGSPALKVNGRMFACVAIHRSAEPGTLAVRVPFPDRDRLIADDRATYYLTDHYVNYPIVLVRLARSDRDTLRELLRLGSRFVSSGARTGPRRQPATRRR